MPDGDATATPEAGREPPVRLPFPTLGVVSIRGFLALGAAVGTVGWAVTAVLTARPDLAAIAPAPLDGPAFLASAAWALPIGVMIAVGAFGTPDRVRFSRPMLAWAPANGLAGLATLGALAGALPDATYWAAWALAGAAGYLGTGLAVRRAGGDGRTWLAAAGCEALVPVAALVAGGPWPFVLLGCLHVLPLVLDAAGAERRPGCFAPALVGFVAGSVLLLAVV